MKRLFDLLVLPTEITDFERGYLTRVNRIALAFFALHVPAIALIAWANDVNVTNAAALAAGVVLGPLLAHALVKSPRTRSIVHGVAAMFMGGVLVHVGRGPVQIEMHFYFFALLAMCSVFGNPLVIVAATVTVGLHHILLWLVIPSSVFNYDAQWWVVAIHAAFVVLEAIAACFIARSFFDNVIGLERLVQARTVALDEKNRDMRLLLDNVQQGFLTIDRGGALAKERSAAIDHWFGVPDAGSSWFDFLHSISPDFEARSRFAWAEVESGVLPLELAMGQMPRQLTRDAASYVIEYRPIGSDEAPMQFLVVVTDVTVDVARIAEEVESRDMFALFEQMAADRSAVEGFLAEGSNILVVITEAGIDAAVAKRLLHTLKGNAALYRIEGVVAACDALEDWALEHHEAPDVDLCRPLIMRWTALCEAAQRLYGHRARLEIDEMTLQRIEQAIVSGESSRALLARIDALRLEPTERRLDHFAEQARRIAARLGKSEVDVCVEHNDVRLEPGRWNEFWSAFVHAIRNALDHGLETSEERAAAGKSARAMIVLRTRADASGLIVEVQDDGRGIDWDAVRNAAVRAGIPHGTQDDLVRALFRDGLSTASADSALSGRGVGMAALLEVTKALEGTVDVRTAPGRGTTISMSFPNAIDAQATAQAS